MNGVNGMAGPQGPVGDKVRFSLFIFSVFIHTKTTLIVCSFLAYRGIRVLQELKGREGLMDPLA